MNKVVSAKLSDELDFLFEEKRKETSLSRSDFLRSIVSNGLSSNYDPNVLKKTEHNIHYQNYSSLMIESERLCTRLVTLEKKVQRLDTNTILKNRHWVIYFSGGMLLLGIGIYIISKPRFPTSPSL